MCVCVCVCVCMPVCPSLNVEPKPIDRSRSNSIYKVLLKISRVFFLAFPLPLKLRVVHIRTKLKISIFSKMVPRNVIEFCALIVHSKPNNMIGLLSGFHAKILKRKYFKKFPSPTVRPKPTDQSRSNSTYRFLLKISLPRIFVSDLPFKLSLVYVRKKLKFLFSQKWLQQIWSHFVGF